MLRRACALVAAVLIPVLAGCEAGNDPPVLQWHPPTAGASKTVVIPGTGGSLAIRNVFLLGAPPPDTALPAGSSAGLFLALINTGPPDRLVRVSAPGTATSVSLPAGGVSLPRDQSALLTGPDPKVVLNGLTQALRSGGDVPILLTFQNTGTVRLDVPVMAQSSYYATFSPAPSPTPTPTARHPHRGHASPGATPTASASRTG